ncbi:ATP-binding protein [Streptomyces albus]|uniref:ATP-binding protein n=1 Tax=Streptomyces albus TaxID=1888 RepID=A0A8H1LHA7_9ACTN|nr:ATP-binding protein [Streptomyces albus]TGG83317.1 ATP-binding protein [Streptomyces albus]UVN56930.1 ATP-binding protein [Streptomyces albus]
MTITAADTMSIGLPEHSRTFPRVPESAGLARDLAVTTLRAWRLEPLLHDTTLVASELVANAVQHGSGRFLVFGVERSSRFRVRVHVTDQSRVRPVLRCPNDEETRGRGLRLVSAFAVVWGIDVHTRGKTVWADLAGTGDMNRP